MDVTYNIGSLLKWVLLSNTVKRNRQVCLFNSVCVIDRHSPDSTGSPLHVASLRRLTEALEREAMFEDEFDEYRARADSGGFLLHHWNHRQRHSKDSPRCAPGSTGDFRDEDNVMTSEQPSSPPVTDTPPINIPANSNIHNFGPRFHSLSYPGESYENMADDLWDVSMEMRRRVSTLPETTFMKMSRGKTPLLGNLRRCSVNETSNGVLRRIRSFKITPKGLVVNTSDGSERDSAGLSRHVSSRSGSTECSSPSVASRSSYTILLTGAKGVGKTHILRQFLLPVTHMDAACSFGKQEHCPCYVTVTVFVFDVLRLICPLNDIFVFYFIQMQM
ncbi:hypothetical protein LSAT2_001852 [Lamellibrachia satsuma]|nr:hypothetical protein LSAT2_001852 [Lamellibrachia satsuma]